MTLRLFPTFIFAALFAAAAPAESPRSMADLRQLIAQAASSGARQVLIPPGVYRGAPADGEKVHLTLRGVHDLDIMATGVTMACTRRTRAIAFDACRNVTLVGLTIDYDPLTFTQGRVVAAAPDDAWIDVKLDAGYPRQPWSRIDVVDPATRFRKHGMPFLWGTTAEMVADDVVRVKLKGIARAAHVGDLASLSAGNEDGGVCHAVTLSDCGGGVALRELTLHCAPGMGIVEGGGAGGTVLDAVRIVPGPPPPGASAPRLLTTSWDGILHSNVARGPLVQHCIIEDCGDDSWSVQNEDLLVLRRTANELILSPRGEGKLSPGDRLCRSVDAPQYAITAIHPATLADLDPEVARQLRDAKPWTLWKVSGRLLRVTLDAEPDYTPGDSLLCPQRQGNGFSFRDNRVHSSGRILIKAGDGLVEGNELRSPHALVVCPELPDGAAVGIRHLMIRDNTITDAGYFCPNWDSSQAGAISITSTATEDRRKTFRPAGAFADITIEGNHLEGICGLNLLLTSARGATLRNNRFAHTHQSEPPATGGAYNIDQHTILDIRRCADVTLDANTFDDVGPFAKSRIRIDPD
jgi:hypothetical protein